ncbi:MAG: carboxylesterase family protein [Dehalococcoidia bacterium]|nr:carboxylesterase family protein [Dehalococcoidia bacterium]
MAIVSTTNGPVEGLERDEHGGPHHAFLGIPFAAGTGGANRFRAPQPVTAWTSTRPTQAFERSAPQGDHPIQGFASSTPRDEDCLYLNVYTPALDGARRPVLFWIHGGGYTHGSGAELLYDGGPLAVRGDVVVVTVHYRLGALGYADFEGLIEGAVANCGLLDQVAALQWVRDNVEAFGGDAGNVTVFGESAGAAAVGALLAATPARGLFHRAILQSGSGRASSKEDASKAADALLHELGLDRASAAQVMDVPWQRIVEAQHRVGRWGPVRDGVLPLAPHEAIRNAQAADVPILIGTNRDEVKLFNATSRDRAIADDALPALVAEALPKASPADVARLVEVYRASRTARSLPASNVDVYDAITSDARFRVNAVRVAEGYRRFPQDAFVYLFSWESPARGGAFGSCHALEMPFVFGTLWAPTQDRFAGSGPEAEALSRQMMDAWIAFARGGNPSHEGIGDWPAYDETARPTMVFDRETRVESDPFAEEREAITPFV